MPRYIDIEQEIEQMQTTLNERAGRSEFADYVFNLFIEKLKKAPTADVIPRSEVEKAEQEVAMEIFAELECNFHEDDFGDLTIDFMEFQELKKKYGGE